MSQTEDEGEDERHFSATMVAAAVIAAIEKSLVLGIVLHGCPVVATKISLHSLRIVVVLEISWHCRRRAVKAACESWVCEGWVLCHPNAEAYSGYYCKDNQRE